MKWIYILVAIAAFSCTDRPKQTTSNTENKRSVKVETTGPPADTIAELQIEAFDVPPDFRGCSGLFTTDTAQQEHQQYYFVTDLQQTAYIKVNGQLNQLTIKENKKDSQRINATYTASGIEVQLEATEKKRLGDEVWWYEGKLTVKKGSQQLTVPVSGAVGC